MYKPDDKIGQLKLSIALELLPGLPPVQGTDYRLIVCDPPWTFNLRETDPTHRGRCPYPNMSDEAILNLPIGASASTNAYLLLWHSRKPDEFWAIANRLASYLDGEKIELFARQQRPGWQVWGAEVN